MNSIDYELEVLASSPTEINRIASRLNKSGYTLVHNLTDSNVTQSRSFKACGFGCPEVARWLRVSEEFSRAIFLLTYRDIQWSNSWKCVIYGGRVIRHIHDGKQQAQAQDWALLDIFAPFQAEYERDLEVGSLWKQWLDDVTTAANELKERPPDSGLSVEKFQDAVNAQELAEHAVKKFLETRSGGSLR